MYITETTILEKTVQVIKVSLPYERILEFEWKYTIYDLKCTSIEKFIYCGLRCVKCKQCLYVALQIVCVVSPNFEKKTITDIKGLQGKLS